jgi:hypothetical protein
MKTRLILASALLMAMQPIRAEEKFDFSKPTYFSKEFKAHPEFWRSVLTEKPVQTTFRLGRSDYQVQSPLIEAFHPTPSASDDFIDGKLRRIPILNLIVPYKMARPPEGRFKHFRWGASEQSWTTIACGTSPGQAWGNGAVSHRSEGSLFSIRW